MDIILPLLWLFILILMCATVNKIRPRNALEVTERRYYQRSRKQLVLVFVHIALPDRGTWTCEDVKEKVSKSFNLIVYQKISFTENATILTVKEGRNATILCEVKGDPEPTVSWHLNGQPIEFSESSKFRKLADGLLIHKVTQNDTGEYTCKAYQFTPEISDFAGANSPNES